jgi:hypothetical protein
MPFYAEPWNVYQDRLRLNIRSLRKVEENVFCTGAGSFNELHHKGVGQVATAGAAAQHCEWQLGRPGVQQVHAEWRGVRVGLAHSGVAAVGGQCAGSGRCQCWWFAAAATAREGNAVAR